MGLHELVLRFNGSASLHKAKKEIAKKGEYNKKIGA